jgi:hypothetical protein
MEWVRYATLDWERSYIIGYFLADSIKKGKRRTKFQSENLWERDHLEEVGIDERIMDPKKTVQDNVDWIYMRI